MSDRHRVDGAFAHALARAVERRGVTLAWLSRRLGERGNGVSVATLSYWRSGRRRPEQHSSLAAIDELERLLHLEPGHLSSRIGPSPRLGPPSEERHLSELMSDRSAINRGLAALGFADLSDPVEVETHVVLDFDAEGRVWLCTTRSLMRARRDGLDRVCQIFTLDGPSETPPSLETAHGFTPGEEWYDPESGVWVLERRLTRALRAGERMVMESSVRVPPMPGAEPLYSHHLPRRSIGVLVWLRFHPDKVPRHCESFTHREHAGEDVDHVDLDLVTTAHASFRLSGPGRAGLRWTW